MGIGYGKEKNERVEKTVKREALSVRSKKLKV